MRCAGYFSVRVPACPKDRGGSLCTQIFSAAKVFGTARGGAIKDLFWHPGTLIWVRSSQVGTSLPPGTLDRGARGPRLGARGPRCWEGALPGGRARAPRWEGALPGPRSARSQVLGAPPRPGSATQEDGRLSGSAPPTWDPAGPSSQVQRAVLPGRERKVPGPGSAAEYLGEQRQRRAAAVAHSQPLP